MGRLKRYIHVKSGNEYEVINVNVLNATNSSNSKRMVLYKSVTTGWTFVREFDEFFDGRFEYIEKED